MNDVTDHVKQDAETPSVKQGVMEAIKKGRVHMRPRWHFVLLSSLAALGVFILFLTSLYIVSLCVFLLRYNGAWFAPSFGGRGWFSFLHSLPWLLIFFIIVFVIVLEILVRRYRFVYRKPLLLSVAVILAIIFGGGFAIAQTSFHRQMMFFAEHHQLPPPLALAYGAPFRAPAPPDVFRGTIIGTTTNGFVIDDQNGAGTTTIFVSVKTRLPYGEDFSVGSEIVVIGDMDASRTVNAFGVREVDE